MSKRLTLEVFKERAHKKHNSFYDYSRSVYNTTNIPLEITCPIHGPFLQKPVHHLQGNGCPKCGKLKIQSKKTNIEFINEASIRHNNFYDYSLVNYTGCDDKIRIICPIHGEFIIRPANHTNLGQGCPKCGRIRSSKKQANADHTFITKANFVHNFKYKYKFSSYISNSKKVIIICPIHGEFQQIPLNHIYNKQGCPKCAQYGFSLDKPAILYYIYDPQEDLYKIGVTNKTLDKRFGKTFLEERNIELLQETNYSKGLDAYLAEQEILEAFNCARCVNESWPENKGGKTEFFNKDILNLKELKNDRNQYK